MNKKALIVFCEGPHDVAFCTLALNEKFGLKKSVLRFKDYPSPFGNFFETQVSAHAQKDLTLSMAHKFFLPDSVFENDENIILVFNSGGKDDIEKVKELIANLNPLIENSAFFPSKNGIFVEDAKYLFLYDADYSLAKEIQIKWHKNFKNIDGNIWLNEKLTILEDARSAISSNLVGVYVWGGDQEYGTLEDILLPMFIDENVIISTEALQKMFQWELVGGVAKKTIAETAKLKKSIITVVGQRKKPGSSMNVVLGQGGFVNKKSIESSIPAMNFCKFLSEFSNIKMI